MNNNEYNNQHNRNDNYSPNNNGMNNNYSNQANNSNVFQNEFYGGGIPNLNNNNFYNSNLGNQTKQKNNNNNKLIYIVIAIVLFIVLIVLLVIPSNNSSSPDSNDILPIINSHKNNTGSTEYKGSDVDYNCSFEQENDKNTLKSYSDIIFNYKTKGSNGEQYNYQAVIYNKMIIEYKNGLTDEAYKEFVESLESIFCIDADCTANHLELPLTTLGMDTVVDRNGNKIVITYHNFRGLGATATKEDMKMVKDEYEKQGFVCK